MGVEVAVGAIAALITFIFGVLGTYVTTRRNTDLQYDAELRRDRLDAYKELWKEFKLVQKYAKSSGDRLRTKNDAGRLAGRLKDWYFDTGGIFLSYEARGDYFAVQEALEGIQYEGKETGGSGASTADEELSDTEYELLRVRASRLRTTLTRDVGTRKTFRFRGDLPALNVKKATGVYLNAETGQSLGVSFSRFVRPWAGLREFGRPWPRLEIRERPDAAVTKVQIESWDRDHRAVTVRARDGAPDRLLHIEVEDGEVIEGPKRWPLGENADLASTSGPPILWRKRTEADD